MTPQYGWLVLEDVLVRSRQKVEIVAELPFGKVRIRAIEKTKIAPGEPWLKPGAEATVATDRVQPIIDPEPTA
jgi:hypothetical protein